MLAHKDPRLPPLVAMLLALVGALPTLRFAWHRAHKVQGAEADTIAQAIVSGNGFSFPGNARWLWHMWEGDPNAYHPTAWVDPVYTYLLAGAHFIFNDYVYFAMYGLNFLCIFVILICAYRIAQRFGGPWIGVAAVAIIACNAKLGRSYFDDITNSSLAGSLIIVCALLTIRYLEEPTPKRLAAAGLITGLTVLACPAIQYFPLLFAAALALFHFRDGIAAATRPVLLLVLAAAVLTPWTIRNYVTFDEFVLVRNGAGQIAWDGTVGTAETFMPGSASSPLPAPWRADGAHEAVHNLLDKELRRAMHRYQVEVLMAAPVPGYDEMNEAQRDKLYLERAMAFIKENPGVAIDMALAKIHIYVMKFGVYGLLVLVLAVAGALLKLQDRRSWPLTLLALAYSAPFILAVAYFGRYRAPLEPVFAVLSAIALGTFATAARRSLATLGFIRSQTAGNMSSSADRALNG